MIANAVQLVHHQLCSYQFRNIVSNKLSNIGVVIGDVCDFGYEKYEILRARKRSRTHTSGASTRVLASTRTTVVNSYLSAKASCPYYGPNLSLKNKVYVFLN